MEVNRNYIMEVLEGIGTFVLGILGLGLIMGLFYFIVGSLTNTTITPGAGRKITITSNKKYSTSEERYLESYAEEIKKTLPKIQAELKEKGIEMSEREILMKIYEEKKKRSSL